MKISIALLFFCVSGFCCAGAVASMDCWATRQVPAPGTVILSSGDPLTIPARACAYDMRSLLLEASLAPLQKMLHSSGLHPIPVAGRGLVLMSFYHYRQSDMGNFWEFYLVTPASRRPHRGFDTVKAFWGALRTNPRHDVSDRLIFHHLYVRSSDPFGMLASREIWGIPSSLGDFVVHENKDHASLDLSVDGRLLVSWRVTRPRWPYASVAMDIHLLAGGADQGHLTLSPVMGEGKAHLKLWQDKHSDLFLGSSELRELWLQLDLKERFVVWGDSLQAVQFAALP